MSAYLIFRFAAHFKRIFKSQPLLHFRLRTVVVRLSRYPLSPPPHTLPMVAMVMASPHLTNRSICNSLSSSLSHTRISHNHTRISSLERVAVVAAAGR